MKEHELAVLTSDLPDKKLQAGDVGTIVLVHADNHAYEVEFCAFDGSTVGVFTLQADHVCPVSSHEILHVRALSA
jgi:hypothetical protein